MEFMGNLRGKGLWERMDFNDDVTKERKYRSIGGQAKRVGRGEKGRGARSRGGGGGEYLKNGVGFGTGFWKEKGKTSLEK